MSDLFTRWIRPEWPAPVHVQAVMTDRHGGVSSAPWQSMNLGDHVGDDAVSVAANRALLAHALRRRPVFMQQVHGTQVLPLDAYTPDGTAADACLTQQTGIACTIMVADCLPVLVCDAEGRTVAAAHAGWRGLAGSHGVGVLENLITALCSPSVGRSDLLVWLGPCIGPDVFEVGLEVWTAFCASDVDAAAFFVPVPEVSHQWRADLAGLARWRLGKMGVTRIFGNTSQPEWCTVSQPSRFFSHRRDSRVLGQTGRMAACIWLER